MLGKRSTSSLSTAESGYAANAGKRGVKAAKKQEWYHNTLPTHQEVAQRIALQCDWSWIEETGFSPKQVEEYQVFLLCKVIAKDVALGAGRKRFLLSPTAEIDEVWHAHMLRPLLYMQMCSTVLGSGAIVFDHQPIASGDSWQVKQKRQQKFEEVKKGAFTAAYSKLQAATDKNTIEEEDDEEDEEEGNDDEEEVDSDEKEAESPNKMMTRSSASSSTASDST